LTPLSAGLAQTDSLGGSVIRFSFNLAHDGLVFNFQRPVVSCLYGARSKSEGRSCDYDGGMRRNAHTPQKRSRSRSSHLFGRLVGPARPAHGSNDESGSKPGCCMAWCVTAAALHKNAPVMSAEASLCVGCWAHPLLHDGGCFTMTVSFPTTPPPFCASNAAGT
jgi:hypothetical protein